jgi:outer membrane protein OmpA-like peptidoglycan-associated protein
MRIVPALAAACALLTGAAPACAAPAAPAAQPARPQLGPFLFFYDYDSDEIAPDAAQVLANVMLAWRTGGGARLVVAGHADRAHSAADSMDISRRRAWRVYDWLIDAGVPPEAIAVHYYGEDRPLVETEDGVREPQNRRVEISFEAAATAP